MTLETGDYGGQGQSKIWCAHLHLVDIEIHALKWHIAFAGQCTQSGTYQWGSIKNPS